MKRLAHPLKKVGVFLYRGRLLEVNPHLFPFPHPLEKVTLLSHQSPHHPRYQSHHGLHIPLLLRIRVHRIIVFLEALWRPFQSLQQQVQQEAPKRLFQGHSLPVYLEAPKRLFQGHSLPVYLEASRRPFQGHSLPVYLEAPKRLFQGRSLIVFLEALWRPFQSLQQQVQQEAPKRLSRPLQPKV